MAPSLKFNCKYYWWHTCVLLAKSLGFTCACLLVIAQLVSQSAGKLISQWSVQVSSLPDRLNDFFNYSCKAFNLRNYEFYQPWDWGLVLEVGRDTWIQENSGGKRGKRDQYDLRERISPRRCHMVGDFEIIVLMRRTFKNWESSFSTLGENEFLPSKTTALHGWIWRLCAL